MKWIEALAEALRRPGRRAVPLDSVGVIDHFLPKGLSILLWHEVGTAPA
jgi:hypothetical protein